MRLCVFVSVCVHCTATIDLSVADPGFLKEYSFKIVWRAFTHRNFCATTPTSSPFPACWACRAVLCSAQLRQVWCALASYPGPFEGRREVPGTHFSCMAYDFCMFYSNSYRL